MNFIMKFCIFLDYFLFPYFFSLYIYVYIVRSAFLKGKKSLNKISNLNLNINCWQFKKKIILSFFTFVLLFSFENLFQFFFKSLGAPCRFFLFSSPHQSFLFSNLSVISSCLSLLFSLTSFLLFLFFFVFFSISYSLTLTPSLFLSFFQFVATVILASIILSFNSNSLSLFCLHEFIFVS